MDDEPGPGISLLDSVQVGQTDLRHEEPYKGDELAWHLLASSWLSCRRTLARMQASNSSKMSKVVEERFSNLVFSPPSIYSALSVVTAGARERTQSELLKALGTGSHEELAENVSNMMQRALPDGTP
uniref:Serpin domain-containing protein n=1 Tax=Oryza punctata TaxID=4537 RepID=A0A0E0LG66_ORYPU